MDDKKRIMELANRSFQTGMYTFTDFLGLAQQSELWELEKEISFAGVKLYGGYEQADRVIARFGREEDMGYDLAFPIVCIHISPLMKKFSDDLSHRDFLGALMNLGIERSTIGDIKVSEKEAYIFCLDNMAQYISDNLFKVKHTSVKCTVLADAESISSHFIDEQPKEKIVVVSSLRADGMISKVYNLSRNESLELFQSQKVFINGKLSENNSQQVKNGDVINARGYGKFKIGSEPKETRKGKISISAYIW